MREPTLLGTQGAISKADATALAALFLFMLMPVYRIAFTYLDRRRLLSLLATVFALSGALFIPVHRAGVDIGYAY